MARLHSALMEGVWDMAIERLVAQELSHDISNSNHQSKTCGLSALVTSILMVLQLTARDISCSVNFSCFKVHSPLKLKI